MKEYKNVVPTTVIPADTSPTTDKLTPNKRYELMKTATENIKIEMKEDGVKNIDNKDIQIHKINDKVKQMKGKLTLGAKRQGTFADHLKDTKAKHKKQHGIENYGSSVFSFCGFDGSEHQNGVLRKINMLTLNTQLFNKLLQEKGITTAQTDNILTIMQVQLNID